MSLGDTYLTVLGWIGSEPDFKEIRQTPHASFRLGSTPRQFDRSLNTYVDKPTTWYTVQCWRSLAQCTGVMWREVSGFIPSSPSSLRPS